MRFREQYSTKTPSEKRTSKMPDTIRRKTLVPSDFPDRRPIVSIAGLKACSKQLKSCMVEMRYEVYLIRDNID